MDLSAKQKKTGLTLLAVGGVLALLFGFWMFGRGDGQASQGTQGSGTAATAQREGEVTAKPADRGRVTELPLETPAPIDATPPTTGMSRAEVALPANFPVPEGAVFIEDVSAGNKHTVLFSVDSAASATDFYRKQLPANRFYVAQARQDPTGQASTEFTFYARGSDLPMVLTIEGQSARLLWEDAPPPPPAPEAPPADRE